MNLITRMQKAVINLKVRGTRNEFSFSNVGNYLNTMSYLIYNSPLISPPVESKLLTTTILIVFKKV